MKKVKLEEIDGFRQPTPEEICLFGNIVREEQKKQIRFNRVVTIVFVVLTIFSFLGILAGGIYAAILMVIFAVIAYIPSKEYRYYQRATDAVTSGNFRVIDGFVSEISCSDFPGDSNVRFRTKLGENCSNWFRIHDAGLKISTPILVAHTKANRGMSWIVRLDLKK